MKRIFLLAALALALCGSSMPATAAQIVLCASARAQANSSAVGQISLLNLSQSYSADAAGCVIAANLADAAIFRANGYAEPGKHRSLIFTTGVATGTTSFLVGQIPAGAYIQQAIVQNTTGNAAGNISFGSTSGGADVAAAVACGANCLAAATLLKTVFSTTAPQQIWMTSTAWGSANISATIVFGYF